MCFSIFCSLATTERTHTGVPCERIRAGRPERLAGVPSAVQCGASNDVSETLL